MTWEIRAAERRDIPDIFAIEQAQFPEPWTKAMLIDEIEKAENRRYTVAIENGVLLGYLGVMFVFEDMHINTIGVVPGQERRGIARSLMNDAWEYAREHGIAKATLEVAVSNEPAKQLYQSFGFMPVGIRKNYYERTKEDALVLWADL